MTVRSSVPVGGISDMGPMAADALAELSGLALAGADRNELAACGTHWLGQLVPGCLAMVVEPGRDAAAGSVLAWSGPGRPLVDADLSFAEGSVFNQALAQPSRVLWATGPSVARALPGRADSLITSSVLVGAGIAAKQGGRSVLAALVDAALLPRAEVVDVALQILTSQLAVACSVAFNRAAVAGAHEAIVKAKLEWEGTADALADVVCLLDRNCRIVRANRVVERWGLCPVGESLGRTPHELFHPGCNVSKCSLASALDTGWRALRQDQPAPFEFDDVDRDRVLGISFRSLHPTSAVVQSVRDSMAVLVVSNVAELHRAREAVNRLNLNLELKVRTRTQELREANRGLRNEVVRRKAAETALRASHNELGILSEQLIAAQENERHRIARELHDSVGQSLIAVKYSMERAAEMLRRPGLGDPWPVLMQAIRGAQETSDSIRTIATSLRPPILDDMGAASAVAWFCRQFAEVYPTLAVTTRVEASDAEVPDRLAIAVFRGAQELLNNVAKHAAARHVDVGLYREPMALVLEVRDDGRGIAAMPVGMPPTHGHGLRNLRERAEMTGGVFSIGPDAAGGTFAQLAWRLSQDDITGPEETQS